MATREIRFRVWKDDTLLDKDFDYYIDFYGSVLHIDNGYDPFTHDIEDCTIEQFTGLRDKNGVEIYEGDIVELDFDEFHSPIPNGFKGAVKYYESSFYVDSGSAGFTVFQEIASWKVIGNIHENPELLEKR